MTLETPANLCLNFLQSVIPNARHTNSGRCSDASTTANMW